MSGNVRRAVTALALGIALTGCSTASVAVSSGSTAAPPDSASPAAPSTRVTSTPALGTPAPIAWIDATPTPALPTAPPSIPPGTPSCGASDVSATVGWQGATGSMAGSIAIANTGASACVVSGPPRLVRLVTAAGALGGVVYRESTFTEPGDGGAASAVLLEPGGEAASFLVWSNLCAQERPSVTRALLTLPDGGDPLVALPIGPGTLGVPRCDVPDAPSTLTAFAFAPVEPQPSSAEPLPARVVLSAPATAIVGQDLEYVVTVTNLGSQPASLIPCPSYTEDLVVGGAALKPPVAQRLLLFCKAIGPAIGPGATVRLAMRLLVPASVPTGPVELMWSLDPGGPFDAGSATARVPITLLGG